MLSRFLVILFFVPLLIWIFLKGDVTFLIFTEVIIGISMFEFYKMLKDKGYEVASRIGMGLGLLLPIMIYFQTKSESIFGPLKVFKLDKIEFNMGGFVVFALMTLAIRQILRVKIKGAMAEISYTLFGIIYISYFFSHIFDVFFWDFLSITFLLMLRFRQLQSMND